MHAALIAALDEPGNVRVNDGDVDAVFARAKRIVEATYSTPYLPRARMEPGNATVLVTDDRVDIWIGDQSPQETRFSAAQITGIPEAERLSAHVPSGRRLRPQRQRSAGRAGDHDREREPRHADPSALDARGRLHRHDLSRDGRRAPEGRARRRRLADRARGAHRDAEGRLRARCVVRRRVALLRAELPVHRITRPTSTCRSARGAAWARPRTSSIARASWTSSRAPRARIRIAIGASCIVAHEAAVQERHDQSARHGGRDVGLGHAAAAGQGACDRARGARGRDRRLRHDQRDGAHGVREPRRQGQARARRRRARQRLRPRESAVGEEADRRSDHLVLQRRDAPGDARSPTAASSRTTSTASRCRASTRIRPRSTSGSSRPGTG